MKFRHSDRGGDGCSGFYLHGHPAIPVATIDYDLKLIGMRLGRTDPAFRVAGYPFTIEVHSFRVFHIPTQGRALAGSD
jgi:hypothetical protein